MAEPKEKVRFGERARLGCWRRRPADASEVLGGTPRTARETQALPGKRRTLPTESEPKQASGRLIKSTQLGLSVRFGERTRLGCWRRRPADASEVLGGTPRTACETQALPGKRETLPTETKPKQASGYRTQSE